MLSIVAYTFNSSTKEAETGRIQAQSGPHSEFQASTGFIERKKKSYLDRIYNDKNHSN